MAQSGRATRAENVCFEWKNGRDANGPLCLLLTQSGHWDGGVATATGHFVFGITLAKSKCAARPAID